MNKKKGCTAAAQNTYVNVDYTSWVAAREIVRDVLESLPVGMPNTLVGKMAERLQSESLAAGFSAPRIVDGLRHQPDGLESLVEVFNFGGITSETVVGVHPLENGVGISIGRQLVELTPQVATQVAQSLTKAVGA